MLVVTTLTLTAPSVSAVGANQNDFGLSMDLPDNMSGVNSSFAANLSGFAPVYFSDFGELDVNDDEDWLAVNLAANEGLALQLSFNTTYTSANGSTYTNDFDLAIYDANGNSMDSSYMFNPESVSTNNSATPHGGTVYVQVYRYDGYGFYTLDIWTFSTSTGNGTGGNGTGGNGSAIPSPCTGNGNAPDILEPNDTPATATLASILPVACTGLSVEINSAGVANDDYYEIQMISGVTYYFNLTFLHTGGDIDATLEDATGSLLSFNSFVSMSSSSDNEAAAYTALSNFTAYFKVYHYASFGGGVLTNNYDISLTTNLPGGGQSFQSVTVTMNGTTDSMLEFTGLTIGDTYLYNHSNVQFFLNDTESWSMPSNGNFSATATTMMANATSASPVCKNLNTVLYQC